MFSAESSVSRPSRYEEDGGGAGQEARQPQVRGIYAGSRSPETPPWRYLPTSRDDTNVHPPGLENRWQRSRRGPIWEPRGEPHGGTTFGCPGPAWTTGRDE